MDLDSLSEQQLVHELNQRSISAKERGDWVALFQQIIADVKSSCLRQSSKAYELYRGSHARSLAKMFVKQRMNELDEFQQEILAVIDERLHQQNRFPSPKSLGNFGPELEQASANAVHEASKNNLNQPSFFQSYLQPTMEYPAHSKNNGLSSFGDSSVAISTSMEFSKESSTTDLDPLITQQGSIADRNLQSAGINSATQSDFLPDCPSSDSFTVQYFVNPQQLMDMANCGMASLDEQTPSKLVDELSLFPFLEQESPITLTSTH